MKNYNIILAEKQQKYQHYHQVKLTNAPDQSQMKERDKFTYSLLSKSFAKANKETG